MAKDSSDILSKINFPPGPAWPKYAQMYFASGCDFLRLAKRLVDKYGDVVHIQINRQHHFYINRPDLIEKILLAGDKIWTSRPQPMRRALGQGLITSQGNLHGLMRKYMQPYFHRQSINGKVGVIDEQVEHQIGHWQDGETRDIFKDMTRFALGTINQVVFGVPIKDDVTLQKIEHAAHIIHHYGHQSLASYINLHLEELPLVGKWTANARALRFMNQLFDQQIFDRRKQGNFDGDDLLSVLLKLQQTPEGAKYLTDKQIRDELMTIFFAGHETTASCMSWTFYLLSQHPHVEKKLHEELNQVLNGRIPTSEDVLNLKYTRMVICESMRLYPPVWTLGRRPVRDAGPFTVGEYDIPSRSMVLISPYLIHHDERYYSDPEHFDPDRFLPEAEAKRSPSVYFPFGNGNRKCIGESLAWLEIILALSIIASRWRLRHAPGHRIAMEPLISLKPKYGMLMKLERRALSSTPSFSTGSNEEPLSCPVSHLCPPSTSH